MDLFYRPIGRVVVIVTSIVVLFFLCPNLARASCGPLRSFLRPITEDNLRGILKIESASFKYPWSKEVFLSTIRDRDTVSMVVEPSKGKAAAFLIYELHDHVIQILDLGVKAEFRHQGIGEALIDEVKHKLSYRDDIDQIIVEISEKNGAALALFSKKGFNAVSRSGKSKDGHDFYLFSFDAKGPMSERVTESLTDVPRDSTPKHRAITDTDISKIWQESKVRFESDPKYHQFQIERIEKMKRLQALLDAEQRGEVGHDERVLIEKLQARINDIINANRRIDLTAAKLKIGKITPGEAQKIYNDILEWTNE